MLRDAYTRELRPVERAARDVVEQTGWHYSGIDTTPALWGEVSIGAAVEALIGAPFGTAGTLAACRALTKAIRAVDVASTGYRGLFLPPLEDKVLASRAYDYYGLNDLLFCSAVCGTGLDAVAIPGDTDLSQLRRILTDVATLSTHLRKPLTGRLIPVPGKQAGESSGALGSLYPMKVLRV
ncbi:MAG: hypothetical protein ACJASY_004231 [Halioglobus sp.]